MKLTRNPISGTNFSNGTIRACSCVLPNLVLITNTAFKLPSIQISIKQCSIGSLRYLMTRWRNFKTDIITSPRLAILMRDLGNIYMQKKSVAKYNSVLIHAIVSFSVDNFVKSMLKVCCSYENICRMKFLHFLSQKQQTHMRI